MLSKVKITSDGVVTNLEVDGVDMSKASAVLFQHIPLSTNGYHEFSMAAGPKDWSLGNEGICIGDSWKKVFGLIEAEDTKIRALVCGDGHMEHESSIGGITQFVSPLGAKYPPVRFTVHA